VKGNSCKKTIGEVKSPKHRPDKITKYAKWEGPVKEKTPKTENIDADLYDVNRDTTVKTAN